MRMCRSLLRALTLCACASFDKTGTLTRSNLRLLGIAGAPEAELKPPEPEQSDAVANNNNNDDDDDDDDDDNEQLDKKESDLVLPVDLDPHSPASIVISGCHSLVFVNDELVGDPLEATALQSCGWTLVANGDGATHAESGASTRVLQRHHFSSALKRMSTVCEVIPGPQGDLPAAFGGAKFVSLVKGAPETIGERLANKPEHFDRSYREHSLKGRRVLALAFRPLPKITKATPARSLPRSETERELIFAGFITFSCPPKKDARRALRSLRESAHQLVMITGDATLTACAVARDLGLVQQPCAMLVGEHWESMAGERIAQFDAFRDAKSELRQQYALCLPGDQLQDVFARSDNKAVDNGALARNLLPHVAVYARTSPVQKERVLATLKEAGFDTLMCTCARDRIAAAVVARQRSFDARRA